MSYVNPHIKVTWADTSESFTPERIKSVKEYFKIKFLKPSNIEPYTRIVVIPYALTPQRISVSII